MTAVGWAIIGIGILIGVAQTIAGNRPSILKNRVNAAPKWETMGCSADTVDVLLEVACEAFAFSPKMKYRLRPDDAVIGLYQILYPRKPWTDQMEVETFLIQIDRDLGLPDADIGPDTSLAEIAKRIDDRKRTLPCT